VYLLICFLAGLLLLIHRRGPWETAVRAAPFLPSLAFFVPWFVVYFIERTPSSSGIRFGTFDKFFGPTFYRPSQILTSFFHYISDYFRDESDDFLFLAMMLVAMALLIVRRAPSVAPGERRKMRFFDLEVLTLALAVSVLVLPQHIEAQAIVSLRHIIFAVLFFFGWLGVDDAPRRLVVPALAALIVIHLATTANLVRGFRAFEAELDGYAELFQAADGGDRLLKLAYNQESRIITYGALWHMHFFYTLEKGGISDLQFAEYPHNPIQYRPDMVPPLMPVEFLHSPVWRYYDYVLLRKSAMPPLKPGGESLEEVSDVADWALYRVSRSPVARGADDAPVARARRKEVEYPLIREVPPPVEGLQNVPAILVGPDRVLPSGLGVRRRFEHLPGLRPHPEGGPVGGPGQ
jgi:hypothetical protein